MSSRSSKWTATLALTLLVSVTADATPPAPVPVTVAPSESEELAEFREVARRLRAGTSPYVGEGHLLAMRQAIAASADGPLPRKLESRVALGLELLKLGDVDGGLASIEEAIEIARPVEGAFRQYAFLFRARALAHLRKAEVENCIARHNAECCIFPLAGGGVHTLDDAATAARADYLRYLEVYPHDLGVRWLLNLTAMAIGDHPEGVPEDLVIPPSAFASARDVGRFTDVAGTMGVDAFNLCGGAIVDDFDLDGRLDIVTSTFDIEGPLLYYAADGDAASPRFDDRSAGSGAADQLGGLNCLSADYDNDGDVDVLVLRGAWLFDDGRIRNSLLENDGHGRFTDVTRAAGIALPASPTQAAAWADFDNDGDLDLFVANEARPGDRSGGNYPSELFRNEGDGKFVEVARQAGVTNSEYAKGVAAGDYDNDGDVDLYVSNIGPNRLYRNDTTSDGMRFTDVAYENGVVEPPRSFATWFFDYDNDGWLDLFVVAYEAPIAAVAADHLGMPYRARIPALYRNTGSGFRDVTKEAGLAHAWLPMGASFGDLDNDGFLDIYLATGDPNLETLMPNVMLRNDGAGGFENVTTSAGLGHLQKGHGVVFADIDNDGDQDIYHQLGGFVRGDRYRNALFMNPGHGNHWLTVRLVGTKSNRSGYGARIAVTVTTPDGPRTIHRAVGSVSSFGSSPTRQEIGLGAAERIERVEITWPASGTKQVLTDVPLDAMIRVTEGADGFERVELERLAFPGS